MQESRILFKLCVLMGLFAGLSVGVVFAFVEVVKGNLLDAGVIFIASPIVHAIMFAVYFLLASPGYQFARKKSLFGLKNILVSEKS